MISVYPESRAKSFTFDFVNEENGAVSPSTASYTLYDELDAEIVSETGLVISSTDTQVTIITTAIDNTLTDQVRGFRRLVLDFQDTDGIDYQYEQQYVLESPGVVEIGGNSFASYGSLILMAQNVADTEALDEASIQDQRSALINAWYNIGDVPLINLGLTDDAGNSVDYQGRELNATRLAALSSSVYERLKRAQIIEANFILGGNPVEDRRRTGMISDSSGESAQFFRTSRPVELPICKAAANALRGLVSWNLKISR